MSDLSLQQEAADASVDFCVAYDSDAPLTRDDAFIAGFKTAAKPRDQRIKRLMPVVIAASEVYEIMGDEGDFAGLRDRLAALHPRDLDG